MFIDRLRTSAPRHPLAFVALSVALSALIVAIAALAIPEPAIAPGGPAARLYQWGSCCSTVCTSAVWLRGGWGVKPGKRRGAFRCRTSERSGSFAHACGQALRSA